MQKLDLSNLTCVESVSDEHAETISAGAFTWNTGRESGISTTNTATINLVGATGLEINNANPGRADSRDAGHTFNLTIRRPSGTIFIEEIAYGQGLDPETLGDALEEGATFIDVRQNAVDTSNAAPVASPSNEGPNSCFFGCNSFYQS